MRSICSKYCHFTNRLCSVTKWGSMFTIFVSMIYITFCVILRRLGHPILGDTELVELSLILIFLLAVAYSQETGQHIKIGLMVDHFPARAQEASDLLAALLTVVASAIASYSFFYDATDDFLGVRMSTTLMHIPRWPFKYVIAVGFLMWGLVAISDFIKSIYQLSGNPLLSEAEENEPSGEGGSDS